MALNQTQKPTIRIGGFFSGIGSHISACERLKDLNRARGMKTGFTC